MYINIYIENLLVAVEESFDCQNAVIYVAKSRGFVVLGMMESSHPINDYFGLVLGQQIGSLNRGPSDEFWEVEKVREGRNVVVVVDVIIVIGSLLTGESVVVTHELYVLRIVEDRQVLNAALAGLEKSEFIWYFKVSDKVEDHANSLGFHWVIWSIVISPYLAAYHHYWLVLHYSSFSLFKSYLKGGELIL